MFVLLILVSFHASGSGSAFPIRIRIQDSQVSADRDPQHWGIVSNFIVIELLVGPEVPLRETGVPVPVLRGPSEEGPLGNKYRRSVL